MKPKSKANNPKRPTGVAVQRVVSLRRWLENNLKYMEDARKKASRRGGWKHYWREGARKIKTHLTTVKMLERAAQANIPSSATPQAGLEPRKRNGGEQ